MVCSPQGAGMDESPSDVEIRDVVQRRWGALLAEVSDGADERDTTGAVLPAKYLAAAGEAGPLSFAAPKEAGGDGKDLLTWGRIVEQIGYLCEDLSFGVLVNIAVSVAHCLTATGRADLVAGYAAPVVRGERISGVAYTEYADPFSLNTTLTRHGGGYLLSGFKSFVSGGLLADSFLVYALDETGDMVGCLAERDDPGVVVQRVDSTCFRSLGGASLTLQQVPLAADRLVVASDGLAHAQEGLSFRRILHIGSPLGRAQAIFETCLARLNTTVRYGQPLADMANVQAILGQMYIALQAARATYYQALSIFTRGEAEPGFDPVISAAKHFVIEQVQFVLHRSLRVLGGYPCLEDLRFGRYLRDFAGLVPLSGAQDTIEVQLGALAVSQHRFRSATGART